MNTSFTKCLQIVLPFLVMICFSSVAFAQPSCDPDIDSPEFICPPSISGECTIDDVPPYADLDAFIADGGSAFDFCLLDTASFSLLSEMSDMGVCPETVTRIYAISDIQGNSATCEQLVTLGVDGELEISECPSDTSLFVDGNCQALVSLIAPTYNTGCAISSAQYTITQDAVISDPIDFESGASFDVILETTDEAVITFTIEDECNRMADCSTIISLVDTIPPTPIQPEDVNVFLAAGECEAVVDYDDPLAFDNCEPIVFSQNNDNTFVNNSVSCALGEMVHYYRIFDFTANTEIYQIQNVVLGVFNSFNNPEVTVLIRQLDGPFLRENLTTIAENTMEIGDMSNVFIDFPISAILSNEIYVLEVVAPNYTDHGFIVGVNNAGETEPSYISSINCGVAEPETISSLGFTAHALVVFMEGVEAESGVQIEGMPSGSIFPAGTTTNTFEFTDEAGNTSQTSFDVIVNEFVPDGLACLTNINLSIDAFTCESVVTPEMVLTTEVLGCLENCTVNIMNEDGSDRSNLFTTADVGQSFMYQVCCGDLCCMGTVHVEDKTPPQIECVNDTISCGELLVFPTPIVTENCTVADIMLVNETFEDVACDDDSLMMVVTRTYVAVDEAGNESNMCEQVLSIRKFDIGTIQPPLNTMIDLECGAAFPTENGAPSVAFFGAPRLNNISLLPNQFLECNLFVDFEDQTIPTGLNSYSIVRTFTATNWYCGQDTTRQFVQVFNIDDNLPPTINCPGDMVFSTSGQECSAEVNLPALVVSDLCDQDVDVTVQYEGGFIDGNGGVAYLPNGTSTVTYSATDDNGNIGSCTFTVMVDDAQAPIAICDQFTVVSLTEDGTAIVDAFEFDDGSYDPCGPITYEVRRMTPNCEPTDVVFGESVTFCCADLGTEQQIVMRLTDEAGNVNECMVFAEVQDKIAPSILQGLPDITLSCEFPFNTEDTEQFGTIQMDVDDIDPILLTAEFVQFNGEAIDGFVLGNCIELTSDEFTFSNINSCGIGTATRVITFSNAQGLTATDVQIITFVNPSPFEYADIDFPDDITFTDICTDGLTDPENLPAGFNYPTFVEDGCDQVGFDYEDQFIDNSNGAESCYKIIRTWSVLDWCQNNNGVYSTFEDTQIIEVYNTTAPEIGGDCTDRSICSYDANCGPAYIELTNFGSDDCTDKDFFVWTYSIDLFSNSTIDINGNSNNASGQYPVGLHTITWRLSDGCGNFDMCTYTFEIQNCKAPTPYCYDNLTAGLTPMDLDGDGEVETEMVMLTPSFFDAGSFHVCGTPVQISFSEDVNDTLRIYGCEDIGEQPIQLWVTGQDGNQDFCTTSIDIQDNNDVDFCPEMLNVSIMGELKTQFEETVGEALVSLEGAELNDMTENDGQYAFVDMPIGGAYTIIPEKNDDPLNGITGLDIVLIQKHILGVELIENPYNLIAADVNNSQTINGQDIIQLRKLLLGHYENFPSNTSWRFIDGDHTFIDPMNPWMADLPEKYNIPALNENMVVDFYGIKTGDVNGSVVPNELIGDAIETRSEHNVKLYLDDVQLEAGEQKWISVKALENIDIVGLQLGMAFAQNGIEILDVASGSLQLDESYYSVTSNNALKLIWTNSSSISLNENDVVFEMLVKANESTNLSRKILLDNAIFNNENYTPSLEVGGVELIVRENNKGISDASITVLTMEQNEPNPWMSDTRISIESSVQGEAKLRVMDIAGKEIYNTIIAMNQGLNEITLKRDDIPSTGILYYEIEMNDVRIMKKMILIK